MSTRVFYEWDIEAIRIEAPGENEEVCDHDFRDPADGGLNAYPAGTFATIDGPHKRAGVQLQLLLVRREITDDCETWIEWAYTARNDTGGLELPDTFDEGSKVPLRFKTELSRWQRKEAKA